jgi:hypothetical protein
MNFKVENTDYEIIIASDSTRDGLGLELWDRDNDKMIAEIFRNDFQKRITFYCLEIELPFELIERFISEFDKSIGRKYQD